MIVIAFKPGMAIHSWLTNQQVVFSMDGTEIAVPVPVDQDMEQLYYSYKKKQHIVTILFIGMLIISCLIIFSHTLQCS